MNPPVFKRRIYIAGALVLILYLVFGARLVDLHFSSKITLPDASTVKPHRGEIKDRNGSVLAMNIEVKSLFANPSEIEDPNKCAALLAPILDLSAREIEDKLSKKRKFVWIRRKIDHIRAREIQSLGIRGLYLRSEDQRVYPHDSCASNLLGFVDIDNSGLDGIEYGYNHLLLHNDHSMRGNSGPGLGYTVILTIDRAMQALAESQIDAAVKRHRARQGMVLIYEVKTGRIRALAKSPRVNPNNIRLSSDIDRKSFTVTDSFEPGSTMKVIALAAMLKYSPAATKRTTTCRGSIEIGGERIRCTHVHGVLTLPDVIKYSCNVGVIESMRPIKKDNWHETLTRFGFGAKTGAGIPGESEGILRGVKEWSALTKYSTSIGQEVSVTSLQLAAAFSAIANEGVYMCPSIIERVETHDGAVVKRFTPRKKGAVTDRETARAMMRIMRGVVESGGTGASAASIYYAAAGKTGTSQKYVRGKGYSDDVIASFIGIAPANNPELCILTVLDDPSDRVTGGAAATPVFAALVDTCLVMNGIKQKGVIARDPMAGKPLSSLEDDGRVPDFTGMALSESLPILVSFQKKYGASYSLKGEGRVESQRPAPGSSAHTNMKIELHFR